MLYKARQQLGGAHGKASTYFQAILSLQIVIGDFIELDGKHRPTFRIDALFSRRFPICFKVSVTQTTEFLDANQKRRIQDAYDLQQHAPWRREDVPVHNLTQSLKTGR